MTNQYAKSMYFDDNMMKIILGNLGLSDFEISEFMDQHRSSIFEIIMMKVFNYYAANSSEDEILALENLMSKASNTGKFEDQESILKIFSNTITRYPELTEEIRQMLAKIHSDMFFSYMEKADEEEQIEILTYMLRKKREVKEQGEILD